jgi:hypothetical protein
MCTHTLKDTIQLSGGQLHKVVIGNSNLNIRASVTLSESNGAFLLQVDCPFLGGPISVFDFK